MREMIKAIVDIPGPFYVRGSRVKFPYITGDDYQFEIGKGTILREGNDVSLIGTGLMVSKCLEAAELLAQEGISARVVNISTIKPVDEDLLVDCASKTNGIVTVEEHSIIGGLGSAVAEVLCEKSPAFIQRVGLKDVFGMSGDADNLLEHFGLTPSNIVAAARNVLESAEGQK
jgi:transketolase